MKNFSKFLFLLTFIVSFCKQNMDVVQPTYTPYGYKGEINGLMLNGRAWLTDSTWKTQAIGYSHIADSVCNSSFGVVRIESFTSSNENRESIAIGGIPLKQGKFSFPNKSRNPLTTCDSTLFAGIILKGLDGDVVVGYYNQLLNVNNSITIEAFDSISRSVSGTFDITFVKDSKNNSYYPNYTDTIRFTNGHFNTKWIK